MLPKKFRLQKFEEIKKKGKLFQFPLFGGLVLPQKEKNNSRFAFVVSSKISKKATERNRAKRLLSEAVRSFLPKIKSGFDVVFFAKKLIVGKEFVEIKNEVERIFKKANLLDVEKSDS